jgi:hypothetical protein
MRRAFSSSSRRRRSFSSCKHMPHCDVCFTSHVRVLCVRARVRACAPCVAARTSNQSAIDMIIIMAWPGAQYTHIHMLVYVNRTAYEITCVHAFHLEKYTKGNKTVEPELCTAIRLRVKSYKLAEVHFDTKNECIICLNIRNTGSESSGFMCTWKVQNKLERFQSCLIWVHDTN